MHLIVVNKYFILKHDVLIRIFTWHIFHDILYVGGFLIFLIHLLIYYLALSCLKDELMGLKEESSNKSLRKYPRRLLSTKSKSKLRLLVFDAQEQISSEAFNVRENVIGNVMDGYYHRLALPHCTKTSRWACILLNTLELVYSLSRFQKRLVVKKFYIYL